KGGGNIDIVNFTRLKQVQCGDYDVILVMDSVHAWSLFNFSLKSFLKKAQNCNNVVLLFTAGDPEWKYRYNDLDAITSASIIGDEDRVFNELTAKIDGLISKM
ncbi:MAG: hypothetical protein GXO75_13355, partial [Calditrichaeota bacterium]|nr:hypothetical protein [Calditrichota bacterium]